MRSIELLLQRHPLVFFHLITALASLVIGVFILSRKKGTTSHRWLGWSWVVLMGCTTVASGFIRGYNMPNIAGFSPIHGLTLLVAFMLPRGIWYIKRGNVVGHRKTMKGLYIGACVVAGIFTLLPGRFLGTLLWKQWLGVMA